MFFQSLASVSCPHDMAILYQKFLYFMEQKYFYSLDIRDVKLS